VRCELNLTSKISTRLEMNVGVTNVGNCVNEEMSRGRDMSRMRTKKTRGEWRKKHSRRVATFGFNQGF
jgi:hypothetical protein